MRYIVIPRIVRANARLPTSAPIDLARDIVTNGENIRVLDSVRPRLLTRKTEIQAIARVCNSM